MINRIAACGWHIPQGVDPQNYTPEVKKDGFEGDFGIY